MVQGNNFNQAKIDVVKSDGSNNFGMWQCEVLDALLAKGLEETVEFIAKSADVEESV